MKTDDFTFDLPEDLIAAHPAQQRDLSRLLVVPREGPILHRVFRDVVEFLRPGDLLVLNDSRVIPARLFARRGTGGQVELLFLEPEAAGRGAGTERWRALARPSKKLREGEVLEVEAGGSLVLGEALGRGEWVVEPAGDGGEPIRVLLERAGEMPLPPYILKRRSALHEARTDPTDRERYQTVYAREDGSVAAPTAGLHFTGELLEELRARGVRSAAVTLHVGAGTFLGMDEGTEVESHVMHEEWYSIPEETAAAVREAREAGGRIVAVGTTAVRALESAWDKEAGGLRPGPGSTRLMIAPGYRFRAVDAMVTNFHLPRSTLLLLVCAFTGRERLLHGYGVAVAARYRFFSYGDAMLLLP